VKNDDEPNDEPKDAPKKEPKERASRAAPRKPAPSGMPGAAIAGLVALAVGGAGGWFGHEAQAKAKLRADSAPAAAGSAASGPCKSWEQKVCAGTGDQSAACAEAKAATDLLTPATCEMALASVPATLAKVKAGRASCDALTGKLCKDLPPNSAACTIVKERTPSFPAARCDEMLAHYDEVLQELRQIDQQQQLMGAAQQGGGMPMGAPGAIPMGALPGAAPGAAPPGAPADPGKP